MKIRSDQELVDFLAASKQKRKRELVAFVNELLLAKKKKNYNIARISRSAIVLSYAHWEGFVKDASEAYVNLVAQKSRSFSSYSNNFKALICRNELRIAKESSRKIGPHLRVVERFTEKLDESISLSTGGAVDTESNLNSEVFSNLCESMGIDYEKRWSTNGPFIDDMFSSRCSIAHGELYEPDAVYSLEVLRFVISSIDKFSTDIENAAIQKAYLQAVH
ncbi:MAE_28990/MAE_18760 family HEPN-like nuclease [Desulfatibacillum aliphaticivorans]|uniref:MAE_28990/MAE_18760 family HEPN-like nuclease n=1 Tax=Desulfatibacillum aliphaticivorans TaxID=218208 RepID=UPI0004846F6E|nr:MAE_28990/MAE_18760 family HEPN-like nuclease [Desulfatibacillum aliphaticivorans]